MNSFFSTLYFICTYLYLLPTLFFFIHCFGVCLFVKKNYICHGWLSHIRMRAAIASCNLAAADFELAVVMKDGFCFVNRLNKIGMAEEET